MKKKIVLMVLVFMMAMGTVVGGSLYGEYKGNPIVKVNSNGKTLAAEDTPAVMLDGRTMVPIYMLRELGADVSWDGTTQSVDVKLPETKTNDRDNLSGIVQALNQMAVEFGASYLNLIYDSLGSYINVRVDSTGDSNKDFNIVGSVSLLAIETDASEAVFNIYSNDVHFAKFTIQRANIEKYFNSQITGEQYVDTWDIQYFEESYNTNNQEQQPNIVVIPNNSDVIKSKIVSDFEGYNNGNIYELANGQYWKQVDYKYAYKYKFNPEVIIYKDGSKYKMSVDGMDEDIEVEKIESTSITVPISNETSLAMCSAINDLYDDQIKELKEELNSRGILNSSILDSRMSNIEEAREDQLELYGCS